MVYHDLSLFVTICHDFRHTLIRIGLLSISYYLMQRFLAITEPQKQGIKQLLEQLSSFAKVFN
jgi:hypothetical protein